MEATEIPIFPLHTVLFPGGRLPLRIFEARYVEMTKACIRDNGVFGVCQIREGQETGKPAVPAHTGCTARIVHWDVPSPGLFNLMTEGETVFHIDQQWAEKSGLLRARVRLAEPCAPVALPARYGRLRQLLEEIVAKLGTGYFATPPQLDDASWVCRRLAEMLPLDREFKLELLDSCDPLPFLAPIEEAVKAASRDA